MSLALGAVTAESPDEDPRTGTPVERGDAPRDGASEEEALLGHVRVALGDLGLDPARVTPGARLVDDLELDSLDWVDLAQRLEGEIPVRIREERLSSLATVADVVTLLRTRLEGASGRGAGRR